MKAIHRLIQFRENKTGERDVLLRRMFNARLHSLAGGGSLCPHCGGYADETEEVNIEEENERLRELAIWKKEKEYAAKLNHAIPFPTRRLKLKGLSQDRKLNEVIDSKTITIKAFQVTPPQRTDSDPKPKFILSEVMAQRFLHASLGFDNEKIKKILAQSPREFAAYAKYHDPTNQNMVGRTHFLMKKVFVAGMPYYQLENKTYIYDVVKPTRRVSK